MLPILHLNGYKIANPTVLARIPQEELESLFAGYGYAPYCLEGDDRGLMHEQMAATLDTILAEIRSIQHRARNGSPGRAPALADVGPAARRRAGPAPRSWTASRSKAPGARTRCP